MRRHSFQPQLDRLEDRTVPSGINVGFRNGVLILKGADNAAAFDQGIVKIVGNQVQGRIVARALDGTLLATKVLRVPLAQVNHIVFRGHAGNDLLFNNSMIGCTAYGGAGNDSLYGGSGKDTLSGDTGNDRLHGGGGDDFLLGGSGDDYLFGGHGNDFLSGGLGNDTLRGEAGNDRLFGDSGNDILLGSTGDDGLYGGSGDDVLYGSSGNDALYGEEGNDQLFGETGADRLEGGDGNDRLFGGSGKDVLIGGAGEDYLDSGWDGTYDTLWGGTEKDVFRRYYTLGFLGIHLYPEEEVRDFEGILGSWDTFDEVFIG